MSNLIRSTEFGDWLVAEISRTKRLTKSLDPVVAGQAQTRLPALDAAKTVLRDYLKLQQKMMAGALVRWD